MGKTYTGKKREAAKKRKRVIRKAAKIAKYSVLLLAFLCGCAHDSTMFVEGTRFRMGVYVPWDGQLYGLQFVEYLNGSCVRAPSNRVVSVQRSFCSSNDYVGVTHTRDASTTGVKVHK